MDTETKTVRAKILRDFNDAGAERRFTKGDTVTIGEGEFVNYRVAGLVEAADASATGDDA